LLQGFFISLFGFIFAGFAGFPERPSGEILFAEFGD